MKNREKLIKGIYHIKVNKKHKLLNIPNNFLSDDVEIFNEQLQTRNSNNEYLSQLTDDKNENFNSSKKEIINYYTEENCQINLTNKASKYNKIYNNKRFNKNNNKINFSSINNKKYQKKFLKKDNDDKLFIYKSETYYPLSKKQESKNENENENNNINNLSVSPIAKTKNLKNFIGGNKINLNGRTEARNKKYYFIDKDNYNNNTLKKNDNCKSVDNFSDLTFNKRGNNFYKSYKNKNNITDIDKEAIMNNYSKNNFNTRNKNIKPDINIPSIINNTPNNRETYIKKRNTINYKDKTSNNESKDTKLINIYKNKLVNIFVRLITNFFINYLKKIYNELIEKLRKNAYDNLYNKKYKTKKLRNSKENRINENEDDKINLFYTKKNNINFQDNNKSKNLAKSLSTNKNFFTTIKHKIADKNKDSLNKNDISNKMIYYSNKTNKDNEENILNKNSSKALYIPAKSRNNNHNNYISSQKESIFSELKIDKNTRLFETNPNLYQGQNINTQINNFYNTSNSNFYINKINSFNSVMTIDKQKPKIFISKNNQQNISSLNDKIITEQEKSIKCAIFKNKRKMNNIIYKKNLTKEKSEDNNIYKSNKFNLNNDNINMFMKRMERVYNKKKENKTNKKMINQTYTVKRIYNKKDISKNYLSLYDNFTSFPNENNYNNIDDVNNYNLEDIDKPMNRVYMKDINDLDEEEEELNDEDTQIKNLLQIKTNDKRLFLNFNYQTINKYNKNHKYKSNNYYMYRIHSIYIEGNNKYLEGNNNYLNTDNNNNICYTQIPKKNNNKNLNKYIKKRRIKNGILKIDNIINDKIFEYKIIILDNLKKIKFKSIIYHIIQNSTIDLLKKYFDIFKNNIKKEQNDKLFDKNIIKIDNKNLFLDKKNINSIIEDNKIEDINKQNKDKLKELVNQINMNNQQENEDENNIIINSSIDEGNESKSNINTRNKNLLWKSLQNINLDNKFNKNIYMKKNIKINNSKNNNNFNDKDKDFYQRKINIFRTKLINYFFYNK